MRKKILEIINVLKPKEEELGNKDYNELIEIKKIIQKYKTQLEKLNKVTDQDYAAKHKELSAKLNSFLKIREKIESNLMQSDGSIYLGTGYEIKILNDIPEQIPVTIQASDKHGHTSVQGTTRAGKTVLMTNTIRQNIYAKENVLVIDPKGGLDQEVLSAMYEFAAEAKMLNYFKYYSLSYPNQSDKLNPLFGLGHEERASLLSTIASMGNSEQFFTDIVYQVTYTISKALEVIELSNMLDNDIKNKALLYEIKKNKYFKKSGSHYLTTINHENNLTNPDVVDIAQNKPTSQNQDSVNKNIVEEKVNDGTKITEKDIQNIKTYYEKSSTFMTFANLSQYVTYDGIKTLEGEVLKAEYHSNENDKDANKTQHNKQLESFMEKRDEALLELQKILSQPKDFFSKISVSLSTLLTQLSTGVMGQIFCTSRINEMMLDLFHPQKRVVALVHPFPLKFRKTSDMYSRIFMLMIENMVGRMGSTGRKLNDRLNVHVDEARSVAYPGLERLPAQAGGFGVCLYFYTQSFADWAGALGSEESAKTMMDNLNNQIRFRMKDQDSAERVSKELGTYEQVSSSAMVDTSGDARIMLGNDEKNYANSQDILKLPVGRAIISTGFKSFLLDTPLYIKPKGIIEMPSAEIENIEVYIRNYENEEVEWRNQTSQISNEPGNMKNVTEEYRLEFQTGTEGQ
ncbi:TraM recognition domain-containing protein [Aquamicrobium sp.]|uniref:TraM recognition domain-containing protein n=1 Tax=Aquamicrobium sp. TaxID=1872579 RepID=UPI00258FFB56|nr:TraM recognition domain-containing protein [Aquamicrobium sp.]MCK9549278.1 TraM recognition domain-containing protein [Aquamicrobium sp.]